MASLLCPLLEMSLLSPFDYFNRLGSQSYPPTHTLVKLCHKGVFCIQWGQGIWFGGAKRGRRLKSLNPFIICSAIALLKSVPGKSKRMERLLIEGIGFPQKIPSQSPSPFLPFPTQFCLHCCFTCPGGCNMFWQHLASAYTTYGSVPKWILIELSMHGWQPFCDSGIPPRTQSG